MLGIHQCMALIYKEIKLEEETEQINRDSVQGRRANN
jgi:hypothetical protein